MAHTFELSPETKKSILETANPLFTFDAIRIEREPDYTWSVVFFAEKREVARLRLGYSWVPSHGNSITIEGLEGTIAKYFDFK